MFLYMLTTKDTILEITNSISVHNKQPLGACYCSLLNTSFSLEKYINNFNNKYSNKLDVTPTVIRNIIKELRNINPYLDVLSLELHDKLGTNILKVKNILVQSHNYLKSADTYYNRLKKGKSAYAIPSMTITPSRDKTEYFENYHISNLLDLLHISAHTLVTNKYHLKRCLYCGKYFVTTKGQTRYCNNPSPTDPSRTCQEIPKVIYDNNDNDFVFDEQWVNDFYELNGLYDRLKTRFYDNAKKENDQEKKQIILKNRKNLMTYAGELKKYVRGSDETNREHYLKLYEKFLNDIKEKTELSPKQFDVTKPNYSIN